VHLRHGTDHRECSSCSQYPLCNPCTDASYTNARRKSQVGIRGVSDSPTEVPFLLNNAGDLPGIMIVSRATDFVCTYVRTRKPRRSIRIESRPFRPHPSTVYGVHIRIPVEINLHR
ncbi:hypothetical protein X777_12588, partial [Ooceraea biroi]